MWSSLLSRPPGNAKYYPTRYEEALVQLPSVNHWAKEYRVVLHTFIKLCFSILTWKSDKKTTKTKVPKKFHQYRNWSFGTLNIRTGKENDDGAKIYSIAKEMSKTDLHFLLLQEVRWKGVGSKLIELDTGDKNLNSIIGRTTRTQLIFVTTA